MRTWHTESAYLRGFKGNELWLILVKWPKISSLQLNDAISTTNKD